MFDKMRCIIVDDEPIARKGMRRLIDRHGGLEILEMFGNAADAEKFMSCNQVDLIFLDIEMPGTTGIEFAARIPRECMVIFTTAYSEHALESYQVDAVDYLVKPIDPARFEKAVEKAELYRRLLIQADRNAAVPDVRPEFIIVKADRKYLRIRVEDILYVEGLKDYLVIHLTDRKIVTRMTVKAMEEELPGEDFIRVNKSYIVNICKIDAFDNNDIMIGQTEISIGLSYRDSVISRLLAPK